MPEPAVERSREQFSIASLDRAWVRQLEQVDVNRSPLPTSRDWVSDLTWLGLESEDEDLVMRTFPDAHADPDRWWVLDRMHAALIDGIPGTDPSVALSRFDDLGAVGTLFPIHALVTVVPEIVRFHQDRGVPTEVTRGTLRVGDAVTHDDSGVPVLDTSGWFLWRFRGLLYQVGVLRVIPVRLGEAPDSEGYYDGTEVHPRAPGHCRGDPALSIHIPASIPFTPRDVRSALDSMARAFASWFAPDPGPRIGTCGSWLLDPQLREYLPAESNIVQFQELFTRFDDGGESASIVQFAFPGNSGTPVDELPAETTLQRAVVRHLQSGRRWRSCGGWTALPQGA